MREGSPVRVLKLCLVKKLVPWSQGILTFLTATWLTLDQNCRNEPQISLATCKAFQGTFALKPNLGSNPGKNLFTTNSTTVSSSRSVVNMVKYHKSLPGSARKHVKQSLAFQIPGLARLLLRSACTSERNDQRTDQGLTIVLKH